MKPLPAFRPLLLLATGLVLDTRHALAAASTRAASGDDEIWFVIAAVLALAALGGVFVFLVNHRLQRQIAAQQRALEAAEARSRGLFENVPVALVEQDFSAVVRWLEQARREGVTDLGAHLAANPGRVEQLFTEIRIVSANRTALRAAGVDDIEGYARTMRIDTRDVRAAFHEEMLAIWEGRSEVTFELRHAGAREEAGHTLLHWSAPRVAGGSPNYGRVQVAFTDLSVLRATQEKLREVEDRWRLAVLGINAGIWELNFRTSEMFMSDRWKEIIGYGPDELPHHRDEFLKRLHPEDRGRVEASLQAFLEHRSARYEEEFRLRCKDGRYKWILSRCQALFDAEGKPLRVVGSHTDIDSARRAVEELRASSERYRRLFESNPSPMWVYDLETHRFLAVNEAAVRNYGWSREEFARMTIFDIRPEEDVPRLKALIDDRRQSDRERVPALWRHLRKDGTLLYARTSAHDHEFDGRPGMLVVAQDVTEQHLAQERLEASEERFRTLFESAVEGVYESTIEGGFRIVNPALARMLGFESGEEMLRPEYRITENFYVRPGRRAEFFELIRDVDVLFDFESEVRTAGGGTRWISENARAVRDANGGLLFIQGFVSDITERKRAEAALRSSEERYRLLFENAPVAILEYDFAPLVAWMQNLRASGVEDLEAFIGREPAAIATAMAGIRIVGVNQESLHMLCAPSKQALTEQIDDVFSPDPDTIRRRITLALWDGRTSVEGELLLRALDGTPRRVFHRWWVPSVGGEPNYAWTQLVMVDLTAIKRTEAALAGERERLSVTLRAMAEGVITTDVHGVVQFVNEGAEELTGWAGGTAIGRPLDEICVLKNEKSQATFRAPAQEALDRNRNVELPFNSVLVDRHGAHRLVEGRCAPIHDTQRNAVGTVLVLRDITDRARLEDELQRASKLESVGILAGGIAHDFNNLLTVVMGNITLSMLDSQVMAAAGGWLRDAERGIMRARDLTQQLLTFARGGEPVRAAVDLAEVVRESAEFALHGSKVRSEFVIEERLWPAEIDKGQIGQVVQNLVINAVQAMPDGGVVRIIIANRALESSPLRPLAAGNYLCTEIHDTGVGIAPENLERIFDPYFTTKESGTGLGLATVYSIIRKHEGHVEVESEPGRGTVFRFWLPARADVRVSAPAGAAAQPAAAPRASNGEGGRILFMDDEEPIRVMARSLLKRIGFEVTAVRDGEQTVKEYRDAMERGERFDLVVMDLTVPGGMGGKEAMDELLKLDPAAKGIVSSGYSRDPIMANYRAHGFVGMVPKPYKLADLAKTIREVLDGEAPAG